MKLNTYRRLARLTKRYVIVSNDQTWISLKKRDGLKYKLIARISKTRRGHFEVNYVKEGWQINFYQLLLMYIFSKTKIENRE